MKNKFIYILLASILFFACDNEDGIYISPEPSFTIETFTGETVANVFEPVTIRITGNANKMVLYTGDVGHIADSAGKVANNIGTYVTAGDIISYSYISIGNYKITLAASSYKAGGTDIERLTYTYNITVLDRDGLNDVRLIKINADGGKVTYSSNKYLNGIDSISIPTEKFEQSQQLNIQRADDKNFYAQTLSEFRLGRQSDDTLTYKKFAIEIPSVLGGFAYYINNRKYQNPVLTNYYRDNDYFLFDTIQLSYGPESSPDLKINSNIVMLQIPEFYSMTFRDSNGIKIDDVFTERENPITGTITPIYNQLIPDLNNPNKFYVVVEYSAVQAGKLGNVKLEYVHRMPEAHTTVYYKGSPITGDGSQTIDLSSGFARLTLKYTDPYFVGLGIDAGLATSTSTIDVYAFMK